MFNIILDKLNGSAAFRLCKRGDFCNGKNNATLPLRPKIRNELSQI